VTFVARDTAATVAGDPPWLLATLNLRSRRSEVSDCTAEVTAGATSGEGDGDAEGLLPKDADADREGDMVGETDLGADTDRDWVGVIDGDEVMLRVTETVGDGVRVVEGLGLALGADSRGGASQTKGFSEAGYAAAKP